MGPVTTISLAVGLAAASDFVTPVLVYFGLDWFKKRKKRPKVRRR